jgi:glycosyltransferase involved in cell wall biosynthesis
MTSTTPSTQDSLLLKHIQVISRLAAVQSCLEQGIAPWKIVNNPAYSSVETPSITILITLFNYESYILECLESVKQSERNGLRSPIEILVIDDCSTDGSAALVGKYLQQSSDAMGLVKKAVNTGLASARNVGLHLARAPYVFILDADNRIAPNCLSRLYSEIVDSDYVSVYGSIRKFDNLTDATIGHISNRPWDVDSLIQDPYIDAMAMFDREKILSLGGYSTELIEYGWFGWEDYDLWLKLAHEKFACKFVPEVLSHYRVHPSSMINSTNLYRLNLSRYLAAKFPELASRHPESHRIFGSWRHEVEKADAYSILQNPDILDKGTGYEVELLKNALHEANQMIAAMESSKFWKLRRRWVRIRDKVFGSAFPG